MVFERWRRIRTWRAIITLEFKLYSAAINLSSLYGIKFAIILCTWCNATESCFKVLMYIKHQCRFLVNIFDKCFSDFLKACN